MSKTTAINGTEVTIPDSISSHPLPEEAITAALDTLSYAVLGILGLILMEDDLDGAVNANVRLRQIAGVLSGMRRELGFGGNLRGDYGEDTETHDPEKDIYTYSAATEQKGDIDFAKMTPGQFDQFRTDLHTSNS
jgi:hypothetical protein